MSTGHRDDRVRVRRARTAVFAVSVAVTAMAVLATLGLVPERVVAARTAQAASDQAVVWSQLSTLAQAVPRARDLPASPTTDTPVATVRDEPALDQTPPAESGAGRRVVFDLSDQQVWLVRSGGSVARTYMVSGSRYDNLQPGRYQVYSRSMHATSLDYTSSMRWMVRFTQGERAAIGFHDIPHGDDGEPVQTWAQLGQPLSDGCIRQRPRDAQALWRFAPVGTEVAVVA